VFSSNVFRSLGACLLALISISNGYGQSLTELRNHLINIQNRAASSLATINSTTLTTNWKAVVDTDAGYIQASATQVRALLSAITGNILEAKSGTTFQTLLDQAQPGDIIILQAGVTYTGNFILRNKQGAGVITITSSRLSELPTGRVSKTMAGLMPKIVSPNGSPAIATADGAHHYRLVGLEITSTVYNNGIVRLGNGTETSEFQLPDQIEVDRVYIHGDSVIGSKRGIALNSKSAKITNSYISDIKSTGQDSQAICGWNGPGPYVIKNNYLEAAGENIMFGGSDPALLGVTPSDIEIRGNYLVKPLAWRAENWVIKNLLELKTGRRVRIYENVFENLWLSGQFGFALLIKPGSENVKTPAITSDVYFYDNLIRNTPGGVNILGSNPTGGKVSKVTISNNVFDNLSRSWGPKAIFLQVLSAVEGLNVSHNTVNLTEVDLAMSFDGAPSTGCVFQSNVFPRGVYGVKGTGTGEGNATLNKYCPGYVMTNNVMYGSGINLGIYPANNFVGSTQTVQTVSTEAAMSTMLQTYFAKAHDGTTPGADHSRLQSVFDVSVRGY
jgi:hypothetical protein